MWSNLRTHLSLSLNGSPDAVATVGMRKAANALCNERGTYNSKASSLSTYRPRKLQLCSRNVCTQRRRALFAPPLESEATGSQPLCMCTVPHDRSQPAAPSVLIVIH